MDTVRPRLVPIAFLTLVLVASVPVAGPTPEPHGTTPSTTHAFHTARHVDAAAGGLYTAQTLTSMRWDVGVEQERWWGRPFWVEPVTGRDVRVAVVDTGIDPTHPDLVGSIVGWADFVHGRRTPYDDDTHGTHVAGIIAAHGHMQWRPDQHYFPFGATGVAPDAKLLVAKAMDREGDGDATSVARAILWAIDPNGDGDRSDGAHVINLSIGLETPPQDPDGPLRNPLTLPTTPRTAEEERLVRQAIDTAVQAGAVVVVAAGNHEAGAAHTTVSFPGNLPNVITVGAVDPDGQAAMFSNEGTPGSGKPDLVAPGILLSTFPRDQDRQDQIIDGYVALGGTSMAAPVVAGTIALMMEADPSLRGLTNDGDLSSRTETVRRILTQTTDPVGNGHNTIYGHGILRANAAVDLVDDGNGPVNWDALFVLGLLAAAIAAVAVLRRRKREIDLRAALLAREARVARERELARAASAGAGAGVGGPHDDTSAPRAEAVWDAFDPPDRGRRAFEHDESRVPAGQRPPWSR